MQTRRSVLKLAASGIAASPLVGAPSFVRAQEKPIRIGEALRIWFGTTWIGAASTIYGILPVIFIIYTPRGIVGLIASRFPAQLLPACRPAL